MSTKKKAKCIVHSYYDKELEKYVDKDEVIEVDDKRLEHLVYRGLVEKVKEEKQKETIEKDKTAAKK